MAPDNGSGNIRVFIRWHDQTVFAGEEVKCTITFKNVAQTAANQQSGGGASQSVLSPLEKGKNAQALHGRVAKAAAAGLTSPTGVVSGRGHRRSALSLSVPPSSSRGSSGSIQWPQTPTISEGRSGHKHKRSVSIVSIGSASTVDDASQRGDAAPSRSSRQRPSWGHSRAASLQIMPRSHMSPPIGSNSNGGFSPRSNSGSLVTASYPPSRFGRVDSASSVASSVSGAARRKPSRASTQPMPEFRFPAAPPDASEAQARDQPAALDAGLLSPKQNQPDSNGLAIRQKDQAGAGMDQRPAPAARILSGTSMAGGTPRSSGEFYAMSNHSSETLVSEYVTQQQNRSHRRPPHLRRSSGLAPQPTKGPESLMMGYAQIQGSFMPDGSLVSLAPFEQVKKKAAVGGRGGGVIGLEQSKRETGLLRSFGWGNIGTSLGDLLGGGDMSTIKEMREVANSKSVPLLSTPQSILFVDLQLAPGETRVFEYTFRLPRGLPPTHKGKAVKITYSLVVGTQRAGGAKEQQVRSVEVPFRVLGSVNSYGEILGHDLMTPYILLKDEARVKNVGKAKKPLRNGQASEPSSTMNEFLAYVEDMMSRPRDENGTTIISPSDTASLRRPSVFDEAATASEAIHLAIMRSNMTGENQQSPNRFEIARNGQRVGVVMLTRPAYRLGEVVTMVVDFTDADVPCYAVHATLETSERVDSSLAVRSESSIQRVTRKVYVTTSQATLYSRRVVFTPTIPISATPEFVTSGVSFEWKIRVEFVMPAQAQEAVSPMEQSGSATSLPPPLATITHPLLEKISQDERGGLVLAAAENLACESFDVTVPLRVYGAVGTGLERLERDEASEEGLVV